MKKASIIIAISLLSSIGLMFGYSSKGGKAKVQDVLRQEKKKEQSRSVYKGTHNPHSEKVVDIAATANGDVKLEREIGLPMLTPALAGPFSLDAFLAKRACDADAIVLGTPTKGTSQLTEDGSFVYTSYDLQIESVLKGNVLQPLLAGQAITVFRTGGTIQLNGKRVVAEYKAAKTLEVGSRYLLFLSFLPEKAAYAADHVGYQIKNEKTVKLTEQKLDQTLETGNDANAFIRSVSTAIAAPCTTAGGAR
ncbi:MAG: hypothetical protein ACXW3C_05445 [Pyrinomonadaceae bacterium]